MSRTPKRSAAGISSLPPSLKKRPKPSASPSAGASSAAKPSTSDPTTNANNPKPSTGDPKASTNDPSTHAPKRPDPTARSVPESESAANQPEPHTTSATDPQPSSEIRSEPPSSSKRRSTAQNLTPKRTRSGNPPRGSTPSIRNFLTPRAKESSTVAIESPKVSTATVVTETPLKPNPIVPELTESQSESSEHISRALPAPRESSPLEQSRSTAPHPNSSTPVQLLHGADPGHEDAHIPQAEQTQEIEPIQVDRPTQPSESMQPVEVVQSAEPVQPVQPVQTQASLQTEAQTEIVRPSPESIRPGKKEKSRVTIPRRKPRVSSPKPPQTPSSAPKAPSPRESLRRLLDLFAQPISAIKDLSGTPIRKQGRPRINFEDGEPQHPDEQMVISARQEAKRRLGCPLPGCTQSFGNGPLLIQHIRSFCHSLPLLLDTVTTKHATKVNDPPIQEAIQTLQSAVQDSTFISGTSDYVIYFGDLAKPTVLRFTLGSAIPSPKTASTEDMLDEDNPSQERQASQERPGAKETQYTPDGESLDACTEDAAPLPARRAQRRARSSLADLDKPSPDTTPRRRGPNAHPSRAPQAFLPVPGMLPSLADQAASIRTDDGCSIPRRPRPSDFEAVDAEAAQGYLPPVQEVKIEQSGGRPLHLTRFQGIWSSGAEGDSCCFLNTGLPTWGLDWCPSSDAHQYLAVGGFKDKSEDRLVGVRQSSEEGNDMLNSIQIWEIPIPETAPEESSDKASKSAQTARDGNPKLVMCLLHDWGDVYELQWCPRGAYESRNNETSEASALPCLGYLAGIFGDGTMNVIAVPHVQPLALALETRTTPLFVRITKPLVSCSLPNTVVWKLAWDDCGRIATGCTDGSICLWDVYETIRETESQGGDSPAGGNYEVEPLFFCLAHDSCIRSIAWIRGADGKTSHLVCTFGSDGRVRIIDIRDPHQGMTISRYRGQIMCGSYDEGTDAILYSELNSIKALPLGDRSGDSGLREVGTEADAFYSMNCIPHRSVRCIAHDTAIWHFAVSKFLPFMISGDCNGNVHISNTSRRDQRPKRGAPDTRTYLVYKLELESQSGMYRYDGVGGKPLPDSLGKSWSFNLDGYRTPDCQIFRVCWSPNPSTAAWIASAGAAGLVRLESTLTLSAH